MKKQIYVLNQRQEETFDAAGKAMRDVFAVLAEYGSKVIWSVPKRCNKFIKILDLPYLVLFLLFCVGRESAVFYSIPENHMKVRMLKKVQKVKHYKLICFINDLNAFRYGAAALSSMDEQARQELEVVGMADTVLIPNCGTEEMLKKIGMTAKLVPVGVWDYLMTKEQSEALAGRRAQALTEQQKMREVSAAQETKAGQEMQKVTRIAFAGNLNKSAFLPLMDIPEGITMELWGKLDDDKKAELYAAQGEKCHYHGVLSSDEIPQAICTMDYGLVWDGEGRDEIAGGLGEYLRYNNSHKCALYLTSGIPVIVWDKSGMSHFVREHECGITIGRLSELKEKLAAADYEKLKAQALAVAEQLQKGYYLKRAIDTALGVAQK